MFDKGGIPMYPALVFAGLTLLTWAIAVVASYLDEGPADFERSSGKEERKAA
jgi:hypothetical protein